MSPPTYTPSQQILGPSTYGKDLPHMCTDICITIGQRAYVGKPPPGARPLNPPADLADTRPTAVHQIDHLPPERRKPYAFLQHSKARQVSPSDSPIGLVASETSPVSVIINSFQIMTEIPQKAIHALPFDGSASLPHLAAPAIRSRAAFLRKKLNTTSPAFAAPPVEQPMEPTSEQQESGCPSGASGKTPIVMVCIANPA
jgi:hypothetical protein